MTVDPQQLARTIREALERFVPDGFRDTDGVWHDGPHLAEALAALDALVGCLPPDDSQAEQADSGGGRAAVVADSQGPPPSGDDAYKALRALYVVAINGTVCTPPDTFSDPFLGGDSSGRWFDIDALKCSECRHAWRLAENVIRAHDAASPARATPATAEPQTEAGGDCEQSPCESSGAEQ